MILKYIIYLNFVIATSAGLLIAGVCNLFGINNYSYYGLFGFFSTLCVYNGQRLFKAKTEAKTPWLKWVYENKKVITLISIISGLLAGYFFIELINNLTLAIIVLVTLSALISFLYVVRIGNRNIREFPYLKVHAIALTWTLIIVLFPIINENINNWDILIFFVPAHYLYFMAVAIPFDIRDLNCDSISQRTIPQVHGVFNAKLISVTLLMLTAITLSFIFLFQLFTPFFIIVMITQILFVLSVTQKRPEFFYSVFLDGSIALLGISYLSLDHGIIEL